MWARVAATLAASFNHTLELNNVSITTSIGLPAEEIAG
jgi:hypothetical protein